MAILALLAVSAEAALAVEVELRVEGSDGTLLDGAVSTEVHPVDGGDGSGPHACSGGLGATPAPTATGALDDGLRGTGITWHGIWDPSFHDLFVDRIGADSSEPPDRYWMLFVNGRPAGGGCTTKVRDGDRVLWSYGVEFEPPSADEPGSKIDKVRPGQRYARGAGPQILRGEHRGAERVRLSLRVGGRRGGRCRAWSARRRSVVRRRCARLPLWFDAELDSAESGAWLARVGPLQPGRHRLRSQALHGREREGRRPGHNDLRFRVLARRGSPRRLRARGLAYLRRAQGHRGGFGVTPRARPSPAITGWAALALGRHRAPGTRRAAAFLRRRVGPTASLPDQARTAAALAEIPRTHRRRRLPRLRSRLVRAQREDGSLRGDVNLTALATLGLRGGGPTARGAARDAARWLAAQQDAQGGLGYRAQAAPDVDSTGLGAWAMSTVAVTRAAAGRAAGFLRAAQGVDGGFPSLPGGASNSQSTGLALAGLRAVGVPPRRSRTEDGIDPLDYLATLARRGGAIDYAQGARQTPVWTTSQALLGVP